MKPVLPLFLFLLSMQVSFASLDSLNQVGLLDDLSNEERWASIEKYINSSSEGDKVNILKGVLIYCEEKKWEYAYANTAKQLGLIHYAKGKYPMALEYYLKALSTYEATGFESDQGAVLQLLATLSKKQKDYKKATAYLDQAMSICMRILDSTCIGTLYDNYGLITAEQGDSKTAKSFYQKTLRIRTLIKDTIGLGYVYSNLAGIATEEGAFEQAEALLFKSNIYKELTNDRFGKGVNFTNLGELYFNQKKFKEAINFFKESLLISNDMGVLDLSQWNYRFLSRSYAELGNTDDALNYLNKSYHLKDSLLNVEKIKQITEMETRFDTERKEQQIDLQKLQIQNQKHHNRNQLLIGLGLLAGLIFSFLFIFINIKNKQKAKIQATRIHYQQELLVNTINTQEQERIRISKELHDGIGQQLSGLKMAWQMLSKKINQEVPAASNKINELTGVLNEAADEVRSLSHQMMPKALQEYGLVPACEDLLHKTFNNIAINYSFEHYGLDNRLSQNIELSTYRIFQEIINNIIKHSVATEVDIQLMKNKAQLLLIVEDNGKGFDASAKTDGHGMMNMNSRCQTVNGKIDFTGADPGTIVTLRIPLAASKKNINTNG